MPTDEPDQPRDVAIEQLREFGLSSYAARTFVALVSLGEGTAEDISEASNVPRTRVYDAAEELSERGLVDSRESSPRRYWPVSAETTGRRFSNDYVRRAGALAEALAELEPESETDDSHEVWPLATREAVVRHAVQLVDEAAHEATVLLGGADVEASLASALRDALNRGVDVTLVAPPRADGGALASVPGADGVERRESWPDPSVERVVLVDDDRALVSSRDDEEGDVTGVWGAGAGNSLVAVVRTLVDSTRQTSGGRL